MQIVDSLLSVTYLKSGAILILFLLLVLWFIKLARKVRENLQISKQRKKELKRIQDLRKSYKQDISSFLNYYRSDISTKLEDDKTENGLFVFWTGAENIFKKFESDTSQLNKLPSIEERVAIRSFYTEARSLIDGILYNNHLLKKYQYLRCKVKTTTATSAELNEVDNVTQEMSMLGTQLRQQHHELIESLRAVKAYF